MALYPVVEVINGQAVFDVNIVELLSKLKLGYAIKILTPAEYITARQRNWYKGICLKELVKNDENGETLEWWDTHLKRHCGGQAYLKIDHHVMRDGTVIARLTTTDVGKKNMTLFIEEILSQSVARGWCVSPPNADLRK